MDLEPMSIDLFYEEKTPGIVRNTDRGYQLFNSKAVQGQSDLYGLGSTELSGLKERLKDLSTEYNLQIQNRVPEILADLQVACDQQSPLVVHKRPLSNTEMSSLVSMLSADVIDETW